MVRREAVNDDVLPLSDPIVTASGKVINEIPIAKGTRVWLSVPGYHMYLPSCKLEVDTD